MIYLTLRLYIFFKSGYVDILSHLQGSAAALWKMEYLNNVRYKYYLWALKF